MNRKCILNITCIIISIFLVSCGFTNDGNSNTNLTIKSNGNHDVLYYNGVNYIEIGEHLETYRYDRWICNNDDFKHLGRVDNQYNMAAKVFSINNEIIIFETFNQIPVWGKSDSFYICEKYYPLDIYYVELSNEIKLNKKMIKISSGESETFRLENICDTTVCIPFCDNGNYISDDKQIEIYCKEFSMLSRIFQIFSDENGNYYILFDLDYLLAINNSTLIDNLNAEEK